MLLDRPQIVEGSEIVNLVVPSAPSGNPDPGEMYFSNGVLYIYDSNTSTFGSLAISGSGTLAAHVSDYTVHITSDQNTFLDALNLPTLTAAVVNALPAHLTDYTMHLTSSQNTLLDGITVTYTDINSIPTLTSNLTTLTSNFNNHAADYSLHLTSSQNTLLDGITVTYTDINSIPTLSSNFNSHIADYSLHLTSAQNTLLDGISGSVTSSDVNTLVGLNTYLQGQSASTLALYLASFSTSVSSGKVSKTGDTMSGNLAMTSGATITGVPIPVNATDVASKAYVDALAGGIDWKQAVKAGTTVPITLSGTQTIDGVSVLAGDRVLVKDQADNTTNGIYVVNSGAWTRAADYDSALEISQSAVYVLAGGTTNGRGSFVQVSNITTFPGDPITFTPFSGPVINSAGNGISLGAGGAVSVRESYGLTFDNSGNLMVDIATGGGLVFTNDTNMQLELQSVGVAGTYNQVTTDAFGRVILGSTQTLYGPYTLGDGYYQYYDSSSGGFKSNPALQISTSFGTIGIGGAPDLSNGHILFVHGSADFFPQTSGTSSIVMHYDSTTVGNLFCDSSFNFHVSNIGSGGIVFEAGGATQMSITNTGSVTIPTGNMTLTSGTFTGNGSGLTSLNAGNLASGTVGTARLGTGTASSSTYLRGDGTWATVSTSSSFSSLTSLPTYQNWNSTVGASTFTGGNLGWRNYGNNYVIFDASNALGPDNSTAVSRQDATNVWASGYPTLMGYNGSNNQTYGVRVDSARLSDLTSQRTFSNVRTDGLNRGTHGSISISSSTGGYSGIDFTDAAVAFLASTGDQSTGVYKSDSTWVWSFNGSGTLTNGTIPAANVSGAVSAASSATLATKASTLAQGGSNGTAMTFNYSAQSGQPTALWGTSDGVTTNVYNPSNFSVNSALTAGNVSSISSAVGSSYTWTGVQNFKSNADTGAVGVTITAPLRAYSDNSSGAIMAFQRSGQYAVNMGLDSDNVFRIGGWSAPGALFAMDMTGNLTVGSSTTSSITLKANNQGSATGIASSVVTSSNAGTLNLITYSSATTASGLQQPSYARLNASSGMSALVIDAAGSTAPIIFGTQSTERMRLDSAGRVQLGAVAPTVFGEALRVERLANGSSAANLMLSNAGTLSASATTLYFTTQTNATAQATLGVIQAVSTDTAGNGYLSIQTTNGGSSATERINISATGVGIGANPALYPLDVINSGGVGIITRSSSSANYSYLTLGTDTSSNLAATINSGHGGSGTTYPISFLIDGTQKMQLSTGGTLGINRTPSSTYKLDVNGGTRTTFLVESEVSLSGTAIDVSTGGYFAKTISGSTTFTVANVPSSGNGISFILDLTNGGSAAITWWSGVKWANGTAPTLTAAGRDVLGFYTYDGGTTWTGLVLAKNVS